MWRCFLRREIISARSDLIRANIYWRSYEGVRTLVAIIAQRRRERNPDASVKEASARRWYSDRLNTIVSYR